MTGPRASDAGTADIRDAARRFEPDHYLAALLSPRDVRDDLVVLAAFLGEIRRVAVSVSEPALGMIRLQWWRDAIAARLSAERSGNPVLDAMLAVAARRGVPAELLEDAVDGAMDELEAPWRSEECLNQHLDRLYGTGFEMARRILVPHEPQAPLLAPLALGAGRAYGAVRLAVRFSGTAIEDAEADGEDVRAKLIAVARENLTSARAMFRTRSRPQRLAYLPLALVEPYMLTLDMKRPTATGAGVDIMPLTRVMRLWLAARFARL